MSAKHSHTQGRDHTDLSRRAWAKSALMLAALATRPYDRDRSIPDSSLESSDLDRDRSAVGGDSFNVFDFGARGDGKTDDHSACQKALDAAARNGGIVIFPKGVFLLQTGGLSAASHVSLVGPGTIRAGGDFAVVMIGASVSDVSLDLLTLDASGLTTHERGNLIELAGDNSAVEIRRCRLLSATRSAIRLTRCHDIRIMDNRIEVPYEHGIDVSAPAEDLWIADNLIWRPGTGYSGSGAHGKGISLAAARGVIRRTSIIGNRVVDARHISIELWSDDEPGHACEVAVISGNEVSQTLTGPDTIGISMAGGSDAIMVGNRVEGGTIGLEVAYSSRVSVVGNLSFHATNTGISVSRSAGGRESPARNVSITDNVIVAPQKQGIEVIGTGASGIIISGNILDGTDGGPTARGVQINTLGETAQFSVTDNVVHGFSHSGLYVVQSAEGVVRGNLCQGNNGALAPNEADIYINMQSARLQDGIRITDNLGSLRRTFAASDGGRDGLLVQGGFRKVTATVSDTPTPVVHGLGYVPSKVLITPRGPAIVWQPSPATAESVMLQASTKTPVTVDVYVA